MTAGTIALTNGSKNVTGTGTAFTTDTAAADFIIVTVGGTTYSLAVDSVTDDTHLKLVVEFDGPTQTGVAWTNVPYGAQMRLSQQMGNDMSRLMRFYLTDKSNWQKILTGPGEVTIKFPDGSEETGLSWPALIAAVGDAYQMKGEIAAGVDLNTLGPDSEGIWHQSVVVNATTALHYPEAAGGTLEILPHRQGAMQRYTSQNGVSYIRTPGDQWNGTDGPWGPWMVQFGKNRLPSTQEVSANNGLPNELPTTLNVFTRATYQAETWLKGDGSNESAALQAAINAVPDGAVLLFPPKQYIVSGVNITKGITLLGQGYLQAGTQFVNPTAAADTLYAKDQNNIEISSIHFRANPKRTGGQFLHFETCHRVFLNRNFFWEYFRAVEFDGGTEINVYWNEGFTTTFGADSGFIALGRTYYTGSIMFSGNYLKVDDSTGANMPDYGIKFGFIDVAYVDGTNTLIRHGADVFICPNGQDQFAHLIKLDGACLDTARNGVKVAPTNGANAELEMSACYSAAMTDVAWLFDSTGGKVTCTITGGEVFNCGVYGIDVRGNNARIIINGVRFSNNGLDIHADASTSQIYASGNYHSDLDDKSASQRPWAIGAGVIGFIRDPMLGAVANPGTNGSAAFTIEGVWSDFAPSITPISGAFGGAVSAVTARYRVDGYRVEGQITCVIPHNTDTNGVRITLPYAARTHVVGHGRNDSNGRMLQCIGTPGDQAAVVFAYDNAHPVAAAGNNTMIIHFSYERVA
ncbi:putative tail fiber protein [Pantoea phage vB_PagS_MED16]|nr:putative tail fiber protein [Pantoea phage vB_PagS_MED16]